MNKNMLLLGMMLVASLSFAADPVPENWMQSVQGRYDCNMNYYDDLYIVASNWEMGTKEQVGELDGYVDVMRGLSWGAMYQDAGCSEYDPSVSAFRGDMSSFNGYVHSFKTLFNSVLKGYLAAHPTDRGDIMDDLNVARGEYINCVRNNNFCSAP